VKLHTNSLMFQVRGSCRPLAPDLFRNVTEERDLAQFFFSGSDGVKPSSLQSQSPRSMSLAEAYEAFSLRHLPVSLETLQS
jgi:hypothetical protein